MSATIPTEIDFGGGARGFLIESHELPLVDLSLCWRSGSALDPADKLGLSRLSARLLRRGAKAWSCEAIEDAIDAYGGEVSMEVSASTISLHMQVIRRNLEPMLGLLTALLTEPTFPEDELGRLQRESLAELIEARDSDRSLASKFFRRALFGEHPYGRGSSGNATSLPSIARADAVAWHARHFRRGNVVVGVSGDVTEADVRRLVAPLVVALPAGDAIVDTVADPVVPPGRRLLLVDKPARTQTQILVGGLGTHPRDADHAALHVANTVFGGTFTARLMKAIRSERGWSYGASSRLPIDRRRESFSMWTFPAATDAAPCLGLELELLERWVDDGITADELAFAQSYLAESYAFDIDTPYKRVRQSVDELLYDLPEGHHARYVESVRAVTLAEANAAVRRRISYADLAICVVGTASELREALVAAVPRLTSVATVAFDSE
jgi:zinc protease